MKLVTYEYEGKQTAGFLSQDESRVFPASMFGYSAKNMNELIRTIPMQELPVLQEKVKQSKEPGFPYGAVKKCAPIPHPAQDIICLGINYMAHAEESARYKQEAFGGERPYAVYFSKRVNEAVADGDGIPAHEDMLENLDYEVELAVIIGKDAKNVPIEAAYDYVFGYTILNDVSAREIQTRHKQWYFGKSLDGFTPMGPWIVTADEFTNPPVLSITSKVNQELRQNSTTDLLIFSIAHVIHELSQGMTLQAGTILSMGTPAGVGMGFQPPKFLRKGDVVTCEIEGIGTLTNPII